MKNNWWDNDFDYRVGYAFGGTAFCSFLIGLIIGKQLALLEGMVFMVITLVIVVLFGLAQKEFMIWLYNNKVKKMGLV